MDMYIAALIVVALLGGLLFTRYSASILFAIAAAVSLFTGLVAEDMVLSKVANEGLVTLVVLLLVAVGLERLPWLGLLSNSLLKGGLRWSLLRLSGVTMLFSALVNNTAVVATLASGLRRSKSPLPSQVLMPLSYAAILGGTLTLIGTSTNLIVSSFLEDASGQGMSFFALLPVALPAALAGVTVMVVTAHRLPAYQRGAVRSSDYLIEMEVEAGSSLIGRSVTENGLRDLGDLFLVEIVRGERLLTPVAPSQRILAGDKLIFSGDISKVSVLEGFDGLRSFAVEEGLLDRNLTEVVVMPTSTLVGQTIKGSAFRSRFDAAVLGVRRDGMRLSGRLGDIRLRAGDFLMLAAGPDFQQRINLRRNFLILDRDVQGAVPSLSVSIVITAALFGVVTLAALGWVSLLKGMAGLLALMLALDVCRVGELRRRFPFELWVVIASALVLAEALTQSGLIGAVVSAIEPWLGSIPVWAALAAIYGLTLLMTELMTNNAAAALVFPLAYSLASALGVQPMAFVAAVALGASASFLTPFGYATNLMVQNLGGYSRADYVRYGLPVSAVYSAVVLYLLPQAYPLALG
jgi:di/tricarboxylate transporter